MLSAAELDFCAYRHAVAQARKQYAFIPPSAVVEEVSAAACEALLAYESARYRPLRCGRPELPADAVPVSNHDLVGLTALNQACAEALGVARPQLYASASVPYLIAAHGDTRDNCLVLARFGSEQLSASALRFVIGQGLGRIHFYSTVGLGAGVCEGALDARAPYGKSFAELQRTQWLPLAWAAQITADRAGLLCVGNLAEGVRALSRVEPPRRRPLARRRGRRPGELSAKNSAVLVETPSGPLELAMRVEMLHLFAESRLFRSSLGVGDGRSLTAVDDDVASGLQLSRRTWSRRA